MHNILTFLVCLILFSAFVYGLARLYKFQNGGLWPWEEPASSTPTKPGEGGPGTPPK